MKLKLKDHIYDKKILATNSILIENLNMSYDK